MVLVTGTGGMNWESRPVDDTTITMIQLFDGVAYAHTRALFDAPARLYKWQAAVENGTGIGSDPWWSYSARGILLRPHLNEVVTRFTLYDMSGRMVNAPVAELAVNIRDLPTVVYIMRLVTNEREARGKVLWLPADR